MKLVTPLLAILLTSLAWATPQDEGGTKSPVSTEGTFVSVSSKGDDVRSVLYDMFQQSGKNFVLDSGVRFVLYLNLEKVSFQEALDIVVTNAEIGYEVKNGVYYIGKNRKTVKAPDAKPVTQPEGKPPVKPIEAPPLPENAPVDKPVNKRLSDSVLQEKLTTRYSITPIRKVFAEFSRQTNVPIEIDANVPDYKLDAFLIDTSLKYALDVICDAAKLKWSFTNHGTIKVEKA